MKQIASAVLSIAVSLSSLALADDELPEIGKAAPTFRLPVYNGAAFGAPVVGIDRFVGPDAQEKDVKVLLISFMASFCGPCKKEMPYLESLYEQYKDFGFRVMMVSIDTDPEGQAKIDELIAQNKVKFPILKDRFNLVARRWLGSQSPLPSVFMVKPDGVVSMVHRGYNQEASELFAHEIEASLGIKRGSASLQNVAAATPQSSDVKPASAATTGQVLPATETKGRKHRSKKSDSATEAPKP